MLQNKLSITAMLLIAFFCWQGCLTYERMRVEIIFAEDFSEGRITITYTNISSGESDHEGQQKDFEELLRIVEGNVLYLDALDQGIYVQEINLRKEEDRLVGSYSGIFRNLKLDDVKMKIRDGERSVVIKKESGERLITNARILETDETYELVWPKSEREIWFEIIPSGDEPVYSLVPFYDEWQRK